MAGRRITLLDDDQWPGEGFGTEMRIAPATAALGIIDVQHYFFDSQSDAAGVLGRHHPELQREVERRTGAMIGNIAALQEAFRGGGNRLFYTRHGMLLADGAEMIERRRERERAARASTGGNAGHMPVKGERGHEILSAVAPLKSELIWDKNTSSAFHTTPIDLYLRNMGIETIVLTGVAADMCVFATALDAADRGFHVIIAADACETFDPGSAEAVQILFGRIWGYVMQTADIVDWFASGRPPERTRLPAQDH